MSQALPQAEGERDDPGEPLKNVDELVAYIAGGAKPRSEFRVGTEHEKFGFLRRDHAPLPYDGPQGVEAILDAIAGLLADAQGNTWLPAKEDGHTVALFGRNHASITLEPGGQIELSGAPLRSVHETCCEVDRHLSLLRQVCIPRGVGFIGMGFHPTASYADLPSVPKSRYRIMERYMPKRGARGLDMMKRTCTVQANFDFENEADMVTSFRTAMAVSPVAAALFVNSPFRDGRPTGALSERMLAWTDTDPDRAGFPDVVFADDFGYERWVDWVLDVPMYFVRRDGTHLDYAGASFRDFMRRGLDDHRATLRDFTDHMTTVFPEVRLKRYLEVRSADCGPWSRICALPALWKGLLYDTAARDAAWALMDEPDASELRALYSDVAMRGFKARYRGRPVLDLARELLDTASAGLRRIACLNGKGEDESKFLAPLIEETNKAETFAERLLGLYHEKWDNSLDPLWEEIEFFPDSEA
jgi:glutamate--cysteine ligase